MGILGNLINLAVGSLLGDARIALARGQVKYFAEMRDMYPGITDYQIIDEALSSRYRITPSNPQWSEIMQRRLPETHTIRDLCHLIADIELHAHLSPVDFFPKWAGGPGIIEETYRVIDEELMRLGVELSE